MLPVFGASRILVIVKVGTAASAATVTLLLK